MKTTALSSASNRPTETVSATTARRTWGYILDRVARGAVVTITKNGRPVAVMLPPDLHEGLTVKRAVPLEEGISATGVDLLATLRAEFDARFARMQTPGARPTKPPDQRLIQPEMLPPPLLGPREHRRTRADIPAFTRKFTSTLCLECINQT